MFITIASITTIRTIYSIRARYIELGLPYRVIKKVKGIKKVRRGGIKNARKGDAIVIASGSNTLSISY